MALQVVLVNDASPGALVDAGITSDETDLTSTLGWAGTTGTFSSTLDVTGNTTIGGTLAVTGATTFTGAVTANGGITLGAGDDLIGSSTSDITINTDKFTVAGATGNTVIAGTVACGAGVAFGATENAATHGVVAIPITKGYQGYTTDATSAIAATLADGAVGQRLFIILTAKDTNNMVITPAHLNGGTTITFDATGEYAELMFVGTGWTMLHGTATLGA